MDSKNQNTFASPSSSSKRKFENDSSDFKAHEKKEKLNESLNKLESEQGFVENQAQEKKFSEKKEKEVKEKKIATGTLLQALIDNDYDLFYQLFFAGIGYNENELKDLIQSATLNKRQDIIDLLKPSLPTEEEKYNKINCFKLDQQENEENTFFIDLTSPNPLKQLEPILKNQPLKVALQDSKQKNELLAFRNEEGETVLHIAAICSSQKDTSLLIEAKADVYAVNNLGESPLIVATKNDNFPALRALLKVPNISLESKSPNGQNFHHAVITAIEYNHDECLEKLIKHLTTQNQSVNLSEEINDILTDGETSGIIAQILIKQSLLPNRPIVFDQEVLSKLQKESAPKVRMPVESQSLKPAENKKLLELRTAIEENDFQKAEAIFKDGFRLSQQQQQDWGNQYIENFKILELLSKYPPKLVDDSDIRSSASSHSRTFEPDLLEQLVPLSPSSSLRSSTSAGSLLVSLSTITSAGRSQSSSSGSSFSSNSSSSNNNSSGNSFLSKSSV